MVSGFQAQKQGTLQSTRTVPVSARIIFVVPLAKVNHTAKSRFKVCAKPHCEVRGRISDHFLRAAIEKQTMGIRLVRCRARILGLTLLPTTPFAARCLRGVVFECSV